MMNDVEKATTKSKTLAEIELRHPDGKVASDALDGLLNNNTQITENGSRVSNDIKQGRGSVTGVASGADREDHIDVDMTLAELSQGRVSKKSSQLKPEPKEGSIVGQQRGHGGNAGEANNAVESAGNNANPRRTARNRAVADRKGDGKESMTAAVVEDDKLEDETKFSVGDFVWGKVKSHPWWPARIFDPSDASDFALKYQHEGRLLIAYFGDGTFGWCDPSQLKPFVENFVEMSRQSNSKGFVAAVEDAANEFGRLVKFEMIRSGITTEKRAAVVNAGIKEGVLPPKGGVGSYSVGKFEPRQFLSDLRHLAMSVSSANLLKLATLRSQIYVIYRSKHESLLVEYLRQDVGGDKEKFLGPVDDVVGDPVEESGQSELGTSECRTLSMKSKSKSITEIMDRAAVMNEAINDDASGKGTQSRETASKSRKNKRRKVGDRCKETGKEVEMKDLKDDDRLAGPSSGRKNLRVASRHDDEHCATQTRQTQKPKELANLGDCVNVPKDQKSMAMILNGKDKKESPSSAVGSIEGGEIISRPRERKKSKYLCPPYTDIDYRSRISTLLKASNFGAVEISNVVPTGEVAPSPSQFIGSPPTAKCSSQTLMMKAPEEAGYEKNKANLSAPQTPKKDLKNGNDHPKSSVASPNNVLSQIHSAALTPTISRENQSIDSIKRFLSSYRSSKYQNPSNYAACEEGNVAYDQSGGQGKSTKTKEKSGGEAPAQDHKESAPKSKTKEARAGKKNVEKDPNSKPWVQMTNQSASSAALNLKFPRDFALPSEGDLTALFGKFGSLEVSKTEASQKSSSAKVVFLKGSDAEAALHSCKESNPFGSTKVSYSICSLRVMPAADMVVEDGSSKALLGSSVKMRSSKKKRPSTSSEVDEGLKFVKQKLEEMVKMVGEADGKVSMEIKSSLENEMKGLLKKVKALPASPPSP